jgi:hypothetical protein
MAGGETSSTGPGDVNDPSTGPGDEDVSSTGDKSSHFKSFSGIGYKI